VTATEPLLSCEKLEIGFTEALAPPIDLAIRPGELWAVVGINGSGKTTWMRTALGLEPPLRGALRLRPGARVAYVPQAAALDPIFPIRVRDVVEMGTLGNGRVAGFARPEDARRTLEALTTVRAEQLLNKPFRDLSGGQRQRVLIARALASGADLFFLDEPTSALDRHVDALRKVPGRAVALITHRMQVLRGLADHALLLDREPPTAIAGTAAEVTASEPFLRLFGVAGTPAETGARS
jgi:zinc transport system ATP-binding protein